MTARDPMPPGTRVTWGDSPHTYVVFDAHPKPGMRWITRESGGNPFTAKMKNLTVVGGIDAQPDLPVTSYAGTSGWSGTDTSRSRAVRSDADGTTSAVQRAVLALLRDAAAYGLTSSEARDALPQFHHGQVSGALTNLNNEAVIEMLTEKRVKCHVYVLPEHIGDRTLYARTKNRRRLDPHEVSLIREALLASDLEGAYTLAVDPTW